MLILDVRLYMFQVLGRRLTGRQSFLRTRVRILILLLYLLESGVSVNLRGGKIGVTHYRLYGVDVRTMVKHSRGKGMSEHVRRLLFQS